MATVIEILKIAVKEIGTKESPANSNNVKYNTWYYGKSVNGSAYPWCAAFICWLFNEIDASKLFCGGKKTAYCPTIENYYKSIGKYYSKTEGKVGDLCLMDFGKGRASHIGIVESKNADGSYVIIEGNTSTTSNDNGGKVMRRIRKTNVIRGFARPEYNDTTNVTTTTTYTKTQFIKDVQSAIGTKVDGIVGNKTLNALVTVSKNKNNKHVSIKPLQKYLNMLGYECGTPDGIFGVKTNNAVISFQKKNNLITDGIVGKATWKKLLIL